MNKDLDLYRVGAIGLGTLVRAVSNHSADKHRIHCIVMSRVHDGTIMYFNADDLDPYSEERNMRD